MRSILLATLTLVTLIVGSSSASAMERGQKKSRYIDPAVAREYGLPAKTTHAKLKRMFFDPKVFSPKRLRPVSKALDDGIRKMGGGLMLPPE
jgi:hypothetical protein